MSLNKHIMYLVKLNRRMIVGRKGICGTNSLHSLKCFAQEQLEGQKMTLPELNVNSIDGKNGSGYFYFHTNQFFEDKCFNEDNKK